MAEKQTCQCCTNLAQEDQKGKLIWTVKVCTASSPAGSWSLFGCIVVQIIISERGRTALWLKHWTMTQKISIESQESLPQTCCLILDRPFRARSSADGNCQTPLNSIVLLQFTPAEDLPPDLSEPQCPTCKMEEIMLDCELFGAGTVSYYM